MDALGMKYVVLASEFGHLAVLNYLHENGCPCPWIKTVVKLHHRREI